MSDQHEYTSDDDDDDDESVQEAMVAMDTDDDDDDVQQPVVEAVAADPDEDDPQDDDVDSPESTTARATAGGKEPRRHDMSRNDTDDDDDPSHEEKSHAESTVNSLVQDPSKDEDDDDDSEQEEEDDVMAAVVLEDDDEGNEDDGDEVAQVVEVVEAVKEDDDEAAAATAVVQEEDEDGAPVEVAKTTTKRKKGHKKKVKKRKKKRRRHHGGGGVAPERLEAAADARDMLLQTVPRLPVVVSDSHIVRSFGRLRVEHDVSSADMLTTTTPFSSASALYPVGFSCDRYEFSPAHGRVLKIRCTILDGAKIQQYRREEQDEANDDDSYQNYNGPIFRVMWGQGVDDDADVMDYPYDPYSASAPIASESDHVDAVALPLVSSDECVLPEVGMRVKVRFEKDEWYSGTIVHVGDEELDKKKRRKRVEICIQYDDGSTEDAIFPDPDISLHLPGSEDDTAEKGIVDLTELNGRSVTSVSGKTPLEAWGKALIRMGLIDEVMFESALNALTSSREEGLAEAKGKLEAQKQQRQQARLKVQQKTQTDEGEEETGTIESTATSPVPSSVVDVEAVSKVDDDEQQLRCDEDHKADVQEEVVQAEPVTEEKEAATEQEEDLLAKVEALREELEQLQDEDRAASIALADARISTIGPLLCNPFRENDPTCAQQSSWLATVIRKEKAKMGSTGNKKKVVTTTDLLERNDTFFNPDIERLVEGLPGSEYCPSYVFQAFRAGGAAGVSQAWVHEAQLRQEKEREKRRKSANEAKVKASQLREKELKKRKRDEVRDARKRQKLEEEEQKKRARVEDRLSRLSLQVDERLFKEACFQREKAVLAMSRTLGKEFMRRRKAAELVSGSTVLTADTRARMRSEQLLADVNATGELPPLSRVYDEDVLRVWDFVMSFGPAFINWGYMASLPTLDSLQEAVDSIRQTYGGPCIAKPKCSKAEAVDLLTGLAVSLCKPLGVSLTKLLFASLIALNPGLQKDYGASFFAEVTDSTKASNTTEEAEGTSSPGLLPVNEMTWQEVARLAFLSDALGELGYSRQECAHLLRGYRSAGHPNSKEAKRLRRAEDFSITLLRQNLAQGGLEPSSAQGAGPSGSFKIRVYVPCAPTASHSDWTFYLHNVKSLPPNAVTAIKANIRKAVALLKKSSRTKPADVDSVSSDLEKSLAMIEKVGASDQMGSSDVSTCNKATSIVLRVLDRVAGEKYSADVVGEVLYHDDIKGAEKQKDDKADGGETSHSSFRQRMGLLNSLVLTDQDYKDLVHAREEYMADALRLKESMERKKAEGEEEEEEEEDDEDEDDDGEADNGKKDSPKSTADEGANNTSNGNENSMDVENEKSASKAENGGTDKRKTIDEKPAATPKEPSAEVVATVVENGEDHDAVAPASGSARIGKTTQYDDFCGDLTRAPELIRRCLAVLRTLCLTGPAEPFLYPVDPQTNPGYYEWILKPMCLREVGKILQEAGKKYSTAPTVAGINCKLSSVSNTQSKETEEAVEAVVAQFGRNVRLIAQNCSSYSNVGASIISSADEMLRIFERLMLDWVLSPGDMLPPLELLDDDKCVEYDVTDEDSLMLICDGCEGKYNMSRLDPPLHQVPKGDWYCPRCISGRCWEALDPRVGKMVQRSAASGNESTHEKQDAASGCGVISRCMFRYADTVGSKPSLMYIVRYKDNVDETWTLEEVDRALAEAGDPVPPVRCLEAVAESPGYGRSTDRGFHADLVPVQLNPAVSDAAAQAIVSSSVFRDTIAASASLLLINPDDMTASEWLRLLILIIMKCSSSQIVLSLTSKLENQAAETMAEKLQESEKVSEVADILPSVTDDENDSQADDMEVDVEPAKGRGMSKDNEGDDFASDEEEWNDEDNPKPRKQKSVDEEEENAPLIELEANAVEVVAEEDLAQVTSSGDVITASSTSIISNDGVQVVPDATLSEDEPWKKQRTAAIAEKERRQKAREDSIAAYCIKNQLRSTLASFEEDAVSQVVDSSLSSTESGLNFASCRCRSHVCDFCGLTDTALGTPLVRVPDETEWNELMPHTSRSRRPFLIADIGSQESNTASSENSALLSPSRSRKKKLMVVSIRVSGELVSEKEDSQCFDGITEGGMLEFLPRREEGFQKELRCRLDAGLPFVSGSLAAHECCAVAAHDARKEQIVQEYRDKYAMLVERDAGMTCGRTLSIGTDSMGRSYWKFHSDSSSLFVCVYELGEAMPAVMNKKWHRFDAPETIASVMVSLGKQEIVRDLKRAFPEAARMLVNGRWSELLQKRAFPLSAKGVQVSVPSPTSRIDDEKAKASEDAPLENDAGEDEPYHEREDVLVESKSGKLLWDATVIGVSKSRDTDKVNGYRVHYKGWSSRFDEWVEPLRVVEPSEYNLQVQEELLEEILAAKEGIPASLEQMVAKGFLKAKNRARGPIDLPNFAEVSRVAPGASFEEQSFETLKAAVLMVEAALPLGAVDVSEKGPWRPELAAQWRLMVENARGPSSLMRCIILLEDAISPEWLTQKVVHLLSCIPLRWKAINEASASSLALRVFLLDSGIKYDTVDRSRSRR